MQTLAPHPDCAPPRTPPEAANQPPKPGPAELAASETVLPSSTTSPTGGEPVPPLVDLPPELVGHPRYRVLKLLGKGGMGAVYLAEHLVMQRQVALKVIQGRLLDLAPETLPRFLQEVKAAARLSHPHIVQAYDADRAGSLHFLVMEYIEGTDLASHLSRRGPLPVAEACDYARQAALGLQEAYEQGMVHRDIKPHNLMLTRTGQVKILDFGLAKFANEQNRQAGPGSLTGSGQVMGTADYIAPEQTRDARSIDIRADIYSLGCTLYQLLSGQLPFAEGSVIEKMIRHASEPPPPLASLRPELPAELLAVVEKMMAKAPSARYQTPAEVVEALAPFACTPAKGAVAAPTTCPGVASFRTDTVVERPAAPGSVHSSGRGWLGKSMAIAGALICVLAAAGVVYRIQTDRGELVISTPNEDVEVLVKEGGKIVRIVDTKTGKVVELKAGDYELELNNQPDRLKLGVHKVTVKRGEVTLATVERLPATEEVVKKPPEPIAPKPVARLNLSPLGAVTLEAGQRKSLTVKVERQNCPGPIKLRLEGLPEGVRARSATLPADTDTCAVELTATAEAKPANLPIRVVAVAAEAHAEDSVRFILKPVAPHVVAQRGVGQLIADLDSDSLLVREAASRELEKLGKAAIPALRDRLTASLSPEARRRLGALLSKDGPSLKIVSADGRRVFVAEGEEIRARSQEDNRLLAKVATKGSPKDLALSADERTLFVLFGDRLESFDTTSMREIWRTTSSGETRRILVSGDGLEVLVLLAGGVVRRYDSKTGKLLAAARGSTVSEIQVHFVNKADVPVSFFLNGGTGLNTHLDPGQHQAFNMVVDPGVQPIVGIYQPGGGRLDFTVAENGRYAFNYKDGKIINFYDP
jgi:predicted Ser/Thr protein kinase